VAEAAGEKERAIEIYVPIFSDNPKQLLGVFELYKNADSIYHGIHKVRVAALLGALGGGLLLYLSLFAIVRKAAKQIEQQNKDLLQVQSDLIASQRMAAVGEMAAAVAHGVGNPLSSIRAAAQVAILDCKGETSGELGRKMESSLRSIMQQVDRVQKRMQGLLNFAKPMEPHPGPVDLNVLLKDIAETLSPRFAEAGVNATLDLDLALPKTIGDPNHLEQVFMGLITNALEATPKDGTVTIRTRMNSNNGNVKGIHVTVEDNGEGIPVENRERVFEPFFTTKPFGTGIGLPLAKRFIERNGGSIEITDAPMTGTKIDVALPLSQ
jgi:two-component system sensor histidine kinase HydH